MADKQTLIAIGAAAVGLYFLVRWNNKGEPLKLPGGATPTAIIPSFNAPPTPAQVTHSNSGQIIASFAPGPAPPPFVPAAPTWGGAMGSNTGAPAPGYTMSATGLRTFSDGSTEQLSPDAFAWWKLQAAGTPVVYG